MIVFIGLFDQFFVVLHSSLEFFGDSRECGVDFATRDDGGNTS